MSNRNKSLARLATWAAGNNGPDAFLHLRDAIDAHTHGAKAVRAIREQAELQFFPASVEYAVHEGRLAFRAALTACGIKGAL